MTEIEELPAKRHGLRVPVQFGAFDKSQVTIAMTFNFNADGVVRECFISAGAAIADDPNQDKITKSGSQMRALVEDACCLISRLLRYGDTCATLAAYLGEDRPEGAMIGPPTSILAAIVRTGADLDNRSEKVTA